MKRRAGRGLCCGAAFSLIEMMVAAAVLGILALLLAEIANRASAAWVRGEAQAARSQAVRAILGSLTANLRTAVRPLDPADQESFQFVVNPPSAGGDFRNRDAVFWQAAVSGPDGGDIAAVGYFVRWFEEEGRPVARLCRLFVEQMDAGGNADGNFRVYTDPAAWVTEAILTAEAPATGAENFEGLLADHVVGFWVRCYNQAGDVVPDFDSRQQNGFPTRIEAGLVMLDSRAARRLDEATAASLRASVAAADSVGGFLSGVQSSPSLRPLLAHLIPYETTLHLEASP